MGRTPDPDRSSRGGATARPMSHMLLGLRRNVGIGNVGTGNVGAGNVGTGNVGTGNVGTEARLNWLIHDAMTPA